MRPGRCVESSTGRLERPANDVDRARDSNRRELDASRRVIADPTHGTRRSRPARRSGSRRSSSTTATTGFATDGTPVDCVRFADLGLLGDRPDLIVSGINHGANLGDDVTYSGTVAAAFEGIVLGIPAIAISQQSERRRDGLPPGASSTSPSARDRPRGRPAAGRRAAAAGTLINVNCPAGELEGIEVTRLGKRLYDDELKLVEEDDGGPQALPDLRLRALVRGRGGHRPGRDRARQGGDHADPLRPHRPRRARAPARLGPRGARRRARRWPLPDERRRRRRSAPTSCASEIERPQPPLLRARRPEIGDDEYDALLNELRDLEDEHPELRHPRLADPAGRRAAPPSASRRSATPSRCSRSATPAAPTSSAPGRRASHNRLQAARHRAGRAALRLRAEDRRARDLAPLRGRRVRPRRHPRRRRDRRGRDPQPAHDRGDPARGSTTRRS